MGTILRQYPALTVLKLSASPECRRRSWGVIAGIADGELTLSHGSEGWNMDNAAILFWVGMAGLLAVAVVLGRWDTEKMAKRIAETYGRDVMEPRVDALVRRPVSSQDVGPPDAALPDGAERVPA